MNSASIIQPSNPFQVAERQGTRRPSHSRGDILSAIVTDINNGLHHLQTRDGMKFSADSSVVSGNIGDELSFEVLEGRMENGRPSLVLKQLQSRQGAQLENSRRAQSTKELFKANGYVSDADSPASEQEEQLERIRAISSIRRQVAQGRSVGPQITGTLAAMGLSIDKISFSMLSGIINDLGIHNARKVADKQAQAAVSNYSERPDAQYSGKTEILDALSRHGVPLTDENIQQVNNAMEMFGSPGDITSHAKVYLLREQLPLNIANIYSGRSLAKPGSVASLSPAELEGLSKAIEDFFSQMNIENTADNKALAQFMIRHSLDITPENLSRLSFLNQLSNTGTREQVLDLLALAMSIGKDPLTVKLDTPLPPPESAPQLTEYYTDLINSFPDVSHISDENLGTALAITNGRNPHTTLAAVRHVARSFAHGAYNLLDELPANDASKKYLSMTRIHLEEIRLKLSFEAAHVLVAKGIDIDTMPLMEALENVKQARREALQGSFTVYTAQAPDESSLALLERTKDALRGIHPLGSATLAHLTLLRGQREPTISSILTSVSHERAKSGYDEFMTTINPKLGDSFAKVKDQFAPFLEGIGVKPTASNISAAEILSKNNIPVTAEKIEQMKLIDREVSFVAERLHPVIAASIIRDGLNPLEMHIRDVIAYIKRWDDAFGVSDTDRIAGYIAQMDRENSLSASEREKMIAFYRVLNQVTRDGSAALGALYKSGGELTLSNMLSSADYYRNSRGGRDSFIYQSTDQGLLDSVVNGNATIRSILKMPSAQPDLASYIARELVPNLPPGELGSVLSQVESRPDITLEEVLSEASHRSAQSEAAKLQAAKHAEAQAHARFHQIYETPPKAIHWLEAHGIKATPTTMAALSALMADPYYIGNELDKARRRITEAINKPEPSANPRDGASSKASAESDATSELGTALDSLEIDNLPNSSGELSSALAPYEDLRLLRSAIRVKSAAANLQGGADYTFPIKLHDRIASLNMYVLNARNLAHAGESHALFALNTGNLGNVFGYATIGESRLSLHISGSDQASLDFLQTQADTLPARLADTLAQAGFAEHEISVSFSREPEDPYPSLEEDMSPRVTLPNYSVGWRV
ncbi:MAG: flagellar hook-length control protein FliK [Defluviitaleaceae bacterium]|nr:flagellar hook-length control protein FliK [Defluviitaleaceae bacterium]